MENDHPHINRLIQCIELEELEQAERYKLDAQHNLKALKSEGLAIHPVKVVRKSFGYAEYPEITFKIPYPAETGNFRDGAAIECFCQGEEGIKGITLTIDGKKGEIRLFAPDFPDWIEDDGVGIKLTPDTRTTSIMKKAVLAIPSNKRMETLFLKIHNSQNQNVTLQKNSTESTEISFVNTKLNESQKHAVKGMLSDTDFTILHGPPGTGKTTTLIEGILQLTQKGKKLLVSAPSNTAVDNIAKGLLSKKINFLRIGNNAKVDEAIFPNTPEGKLIENKQDKEIKKLRIRVDELRKMANQYRRNFGKDEREQRKLLLKEVQSIRQEIKLIQQYNEEKLFDEAQVVLGTPIGLQDEHVVKYNFDTLIIDEAGQCLEPLAWCIFPLAQKIILAGDHLQLPPTVLSEKAMKLGFNKSILETCFGKFDAAFFLNTQYRMKSPIAQFSNEYFYEGNLKTIDARISDNEHLFFYDTAGTGFEEETGNDGMSLLNIGELEVVSKLIENHQLNLEETAFISPYSGQVAAARDSLSDQIRISTIDSFQGQEEENIIISLVRSNSENQIGFLKDYRRMNVAMTRAKEKLYIIGDSATLSNDPYFEALLNYLERINAYKSAWELIYT
jgi:ATP-dependent RNA/DNA helicase IGHMBP2